LRGVNLLGIDSVMQPYENRLRAWQRIGKDLPMDKLANPERSSARARGCGCECVAPFKTLRRWVLKPCSGGAFFLKQVRAVLIPHLFFGQTASGVSALVFASALGS